MSLLRQIWRLRHSFDVEKTSITSNDTSDEPILVSFKNVDPHDPRQWSALRKFRCVVIIWLMVFITGWSSSADATSHEITAKDFQVSQVVESLATSMYLFGVAFGALVAGPCSESFGRNPTYLLTFLVYLLWTLASALSPNLAAQIVFRGLAGFFAAATMSIYGGSLADLFDTAVRAKVWPVFALSPLLGPTIAPVANGWIAQRLGWRWNDWMTLIVSSAIFVLALAGLPETSGDIILFYKATALRHATGSPKFRTRLGNGDKLLGRMRQNFIRMAQFIVMEPTTILFGLYLTVLYLLIFGFLEGFDFIFSMTYGFDVGHRYSVFAAIAIGVLLGLPYVLAINLRSRSSMSCPEHRLEPALFTAPLLPIALFWIGWTDRSDVSVWSPICGCALFGFSIMGLFTATYSFLIDTYGTTASSALSAITFVRYLASGGMVIATEPLYTALSVRWMLTLLGCIAAVLAPVPWVFFYAGSRIRSKSKVGI